MADRPDDRLDVLLGAWARQQRLDAAQAGDMLQAILRQPREPLPASWWSDLTAQVTAAVVQATAPPTTSFGSLRLGVAVGAAW